jgi:hypothetical protein
MRVLVLLVLASAAALAACAGQPAFESRDVRCPDAGVCPSGFTCGYGDWCYAEDEPVADFAGTYSVTSTQGENGCMLDDWTEGQVSDDIQVTVTQEGRAVELVIQGAAGLIYNLYLGSNRITGTVVNGITLELAYDGTNEVNTTDPPCNFYLNASGGAVLEGDLLEGHLDLIAARADCDELKDCRMRVALSGVR